MQNPSRIEVGDAELAEMLLAARCTRPVEGLTHPFYRYPARFSPQFARSAIELFSRPGDLVVDPFMGGGTTIVEAVALGRRAYGIDLNQLATFIARAKLAILNRDEEKSVANWLASVVPTISFRAKTAVKPEPPQHYMRNLQLPSARPIKKALRQAIAQVDTLPTPRTRQFIRCVLLRTAQWALDGRRSSPSLNEFRKKIPVFAEEMLVGLAELRGVTSLSAIPSTDYRIDCGRAETLLSRSPFRAGARASLAVTSPPYPGVHVLYHRWQVGGRRETPAPYWIANAQDGRGAAYYNFGNRHDPAQRDFFNIYDKSLRALRSIMKPGGLVVQLLSFRTPKAHLSIANDLMRDASFREVSPAAALNSLTRQVPNRRWHASQKLSCCSATEFLSVHVAD
jgi:hypothetical protein